MNVFSAFDGTACGYVALERAGIKVDNYIASEIDKPAMFISNKNYSNIRQVGSITELTRNQILDLPKIDLFIGGSPCQGFSVAGKMKGSSTKEGIDITSLAQYLELKELGFEFDGQSYLFWEYVRVWKILKSVNPDLKFLLENVKIVKKWLPMFNETMGMEPHKINSRLVSAQNRVRYYWTNIPNVTQPEDKGIVLKDILESNVDEKYYAGENLQKGYEGGSQLNPNYKSQANTIHDGDKSGTICAGTHGYANGYIEAPKILCGASRGRYIVDGKRQDGKMKTAGLTQQMLEIRPDEKTNCLTTVGKDNLVVIGLNHGDRVPLSGVKSVKGENISPTYRRFTPVECERLQTLPDNYTEGVSDSQRYKMLGNGWTVDVIAHIFKNLK